MVRRVARMDNAAISSRTDDQDLARRAPSLAKLVEALQQLDTHDAAALGNALRENPVSFDDVRTFIRFDPINYVRSLVYREEKFEVRLLCWRPGQASALHGHGKSACAFRIVRGAATEIVMGGRDRVYAPGTTVEEADPMRVHQVMNADSDSLLSLHVYSPPIPVDAPSDRRGREVVVVGGGLSGAAVAYHLLSRGERDLRVSLIERGPFIGRGVAYGVESDLFLLNVPASRMSIDPDVPDDFVRYAGAQKTPHAFLPRALYGAYVNERLASIVREKRGKLRVYRDDAIAIRKSDNGAEVEMRSGLRLNGRNVVLATGMSPRMTSGGSDPRVIDAWDECGLGGLPRYGRILILGSGLSALDVVAWLEHIHFRGTIRMVSPRGLLPLPHREPFTPVKAFDREAIGSIPHNLSAQMAWIHARIREAVAAGDGFQTAMDRIRPHIETLYRSLPPHDRNRFIRHVRPLWDVLRHRAPRESLARVERMQESGMLERTAGRVVNEDRSGEKIVVDLRLRNGTILKDSFDAIVRCIGPALSINEHATPLTHSLIANELAMLDSTGIGLATDHDGRMILPSGEASNVIFGLGAVQRASSWETTSVPDISVQARTIAQLCLK